MKWEGKIKKGVPLEKALGRFDWCEISYCKQEQEAPIKRLDKLISNLKIKLESGETEEVRQILKTAIKGLEHERLGRND